MNEDTLIACGCLALLIAETSTEESSEVTDESDEETRMQNANTKKLWVRKWIQRRNEGRGSLHLLHDELRIEDATLFRNFIRMDEACFNIILDKSKHLYTYKDTHMRNCISPRDRLSVTLRFLATGESLRSLSFQFRIGISTLSTIIPEVVNAIYNTLKDEYMKAPCTEAEWLKIAEEFYIKWNFPNCIGAIDGKHITFRPPRTDGSFYRNYKGTDSIVLMAITDANYKILLLDVGTNGRISDGGVFSRSGIQEFIFKNKLKIPSNAKLPQSDITTPYVLVADDAFPLNRRLMKPFKYHGLNHAQKIYNYRLSRARRIIEDAFGLLANRFRILLNPMQLDVNKVEQICLCCCFLHNFLIAHNRQQYANLEDISAERLNSVSWTQPNRSATEATDIRKKFVDFFNGIGAVPWQNDRI